MDSVCAIIICFFPVYEKLDRLIKAIESSVDQIILFDNGGLKDVGFVFERKNLKIESPGKNVGLGAALNIGCETALASGCRFIISFDQDSNPGEDMIPILKEEILKCQRIDANVIAIGPQLVDKRQDMELVSPFIRFKRFGFLKWSGDGTEWVSQLITSGCMIDLRVWDHSARFDDRLFIDLVDNNWCWRMVRRGYVIMGTTNARMPHEISEGIERRRGFFTNIYNPVRRYFQSRNAMYHLVHEPLSMAQKMYLIRAVAVTFVSAMISDAHPLNSIRHCFLGIAHGIANKLGPYPMQ